MIAPVSMARGVLALLAAGLVAQEATGAHLVEHPARRFALALPDAWAQTLLTDCHDGDDCVAEAHFTRGDGAWIRVVVDPPGSPHEVDVALQARVNGDGRLGVTAVPGADRQRLVSVAASAAGHRYLLLIASGGEDDVRRSDLEALLAGFRVRWQDG